MLNEALYWFGAAPRGGECVCWGYGGGGGGGKRKRRLWVGRREGKTDKIKFSVPLVLID